MIKKKVCLLGSFAVGKTSLVQRFVKGFFSEKYQTTLGVKIDKKTIDIDQTAVELILWDLAGEDNFMKVRQSYLRGAAGYFLVVDGTRQETLTTALELHQKMQQQDEGIPFILLLNKSDLKQQWEIDTQQLEQLACQGWTIISTSAKEDKGVQTAFLELARQMIA